MRIGLMVLPTMQFEQFGYQCRPGQEIPEAEYKRWMRMDAAALTNRLQGGWVAWLPIAEAGDAQPNGAPSFDTMDQAQLIEFAKEHLTDFTVDKRTKLENLRQQVRAMFERQLLINKAKMTTLKAAQAPEPDDAGGAGAPNDGTGGPPPT